MIHHVASSMLCLGQNLKDLVAFEFQRWLDLEWHAERMEASLSCFGPRGPRSQTAFPIRALDFSVAALSWHLDDGRRRRPRERWLGMGLNMSDSPFLFLSLVIHLFSAFVQHLLQWPSLFPLSPSHRRGHITTHLDACDGALDQRSPPRRGRSAGGQTSLHNLFI